MNATCLISLAALLFAASRVGADETLPVRDLRGYGVTSAEQRGGDVLVRAESPAKALLWAARYDHVYAAHRARPGVYRLPGGGWTKIAVRGRVFGVRYSDEEPAGSFEAALPEIEASGISVGLRAPDSGVKRCEHGARSAECLQRAV